jgi:hypothetical protein
MVKSDHGESSLIKLFFIPRNGKNRQIRCQIRGLLAFGMLRLASAAPAQSNPVKPSQTKNNGLTQKLTQKSPI